MQRARLVQPYAPGVSQRSLGRVLPDGFQHPEADPVRGTVHDEQALFDERVENWGDIERDDAAIGAHCLCGREVPAAGEHATPLQGMVLLGVE